MSLASRAPSPSRMADASETERRGRVLVVDDEAPITELLSRLA